MVELSTRHLGISSQTSNQLSRLARAWPRRKEKFARAAALNFATASSVLVKMPKVFPDPSPGMSAPTEDAGARPAPISLREDANSEMQTPEVRSRSSSRNLWNVARVAFGGGGSAASKPTSAEGSTGLSSSQRRKQKAAVRFASFKSMSQVARETSVHKGEASYGRFMRVSSADPELRHPRSYMEFYKVVTGGRRDASAFIDNRVDPLGFRTTAESLRMRLRRMNHLLVNPSSKRMQYWDMYMLLLLGFTATVTPYEVCMMWEPTTYNSPLYIINWIVNFSFILDIILNFFVPYRENAAQGTPLVKDHRKIAIRYLRFWFLIDLLSVIPVDTILMSVDSGSSNSDVDLAASLETIRLLRLMRLLRLIKLLRILRASRIFARWEQYINLSFSNRELLKWMTIVIMLLHLLACCLGLLAQLSPGQRSHSLQIALSERIDQGGDDTSYGYGHTGDTCFGCIVGDPSMERFCQSTCLTPCEKDILARAQLAEQYAAATAAASGSFEPFEQEIQHQRQLVHKSETWVCRFNQLGVVSTPDHSEQLWVAALYVGLIMLSGGVGSIYPENPGEYTLFICGILLGSVTWAMVVGTVCAMLTAGDPHTIEYNYRMDQLNSFLAETGVPQQISVQARSYMRNTKELRRKSAYDDVVSHLSPGLRGEIMLYLSTTTFSHVYYLSGIEGDCLVQLAARLTRHGYPPRERMASIDLNIILRGIAARSGELLYGGMCWGVDCILTSGVLRDTRPTTALTYVEVQALSRANLFEVLESYPESAKMVQNAAVRMALKRTVILLKAYADSQHVKASKESEGPGLAPNSSAAYNMLTAAFQPRESAAVEMDLGQIFRIITGSRLRDLDENGNLVEQVEASPTSKFAMSDAEEKRAMRRQVDGLAMDVQSMRTSLKEVERMCRELTGKAPT